MLKSLLARRPGLRVPGAVDGFELALRAVLGQQVTVRGATTLAGRLARLLAESLPGAPPAVACLPVSAERPADARENSVRALAWLRKSRISGTEKSAFFPARLGGGLVEIHRLLVVPMGERPEQHPAEHAEHSSVRADAEGEGENHGGGEAWRLARERKA